jgi:peptidoglycan/xylan/chitin deacetylase (PgdA/CDA1 family)
MIKQILLIAIFLIPISSQAKIRIAVTVDDLPRHAKMPSDASRLEIAQKMLTVLKQQGVPEVYGFINVEKMKSDKKLGEVLKLWNASGYPLGNHTYSHKSINEIEIDDFKREIDKNETALQEFSPNYDWKYFRYPFLHEGNTLEKRNAIRTYLIEKGYKSAQVTIDFEDWSWNEPYARCSDKKDTKQIQWLKDTYLKNSIDQLHRAETISQAIFHRSISHILLLHIGAFDAEMIGDLLKNYKKEGVEFIPLSEAVKDEIYSIDPAVTNDSGSEFTYQIMKSRGLKQKDVGLQPYDGYPNEKLNSICR